MGWYHLYPSSDFTITTYLVLYNKALLTEILEGTYIRSAINNPYPSLKTETHIFATQRGEMWWCFSWYQTQPTSFMDD